MGRLSEKFNLYISPQMAAALEREAIRRMISQSAVVRVAIAKELGLYPPLPENQTTVAGPCEGDRQVAEAAT